MDNRVSGNTLVPPKIYSLVQCSQESVPFLGSSLELNREIISLIVVSSDLLIMFLFMHAVFSLRSYDQLTIEDLKHGSNLRIEDFSVYMNTIPVEQDVYQDDTNVLSSILIPYIEEEVFTELIEQGFSTEKAK